MVAKPILIHELAHVPASTKGNAAGDKRPPHECQRIPQGVSELLPSQAVRIPVSHFTHLQR